MGKITKTAAGTLIALSISSTIMATEKKEINYVVDRFADIQVLRYEVPGFGELSLNQKKLIYYLSEAALMGRDILWDQNCRYNLQLRRLLETIYVNYDSDREEPQFKALEKYLKQVWFANGIHHHYSMDKFTPEFSKEFFLSRVGALPEGERPSNLEELTRVIFDPACMAKRVNQARGEDLIVTSANNMYSGVTQAEVEEYFASVKDTADLRPISHGLNSRKVKEDGKLREQVYRIGGTYSQAIVKIVAMLEKASEFAENPAQRKTIEKLVEYYKTGDLRLFDEYSILWLEDTASAVDFVNGFIETYGDPLGITGSWESVVDFKDVAASHRTEVISDNAQWFEDHSPIDPRFRKERVKGVSAKVITAAMLSGDCYPSTPIGINLPNADWIRAAHGSKSVTLENITRAYDEASHGGGFNDEFVIDPETRERLEKHLFTTDNLHTDLHECLGHGSGKLLPGVDTDTLKAYGATVEEARADLWALCSLGGDTLLELGVLDDADAYKAEYYKYMLNGLMTQLVRIEPGKDVEEAHMRNRKLIAQWVYEKGERDSVVEFVKIDGKTFIRINDYPKLRTLFGELLGEIQRIKSEGDYPAARDLVERYGVKVDPELHREVLERYAKLDIAPYKGFVNPVYTPVINSRGDITDITVGYDESFVGQMLRYSRDYSPLTE